MFPFKKRKSKVNTISGLNSGFSLVELIIVIAIMAVLIGALTPQMVKYIRKARIASDKVLCDTMAKAVSAAIEDPEVSKDSSANVPILNLRNGAVTLESLQTTPENMLVKEIKDILGIDDLNQSTYEALIKSPHDRDNCEIYIFYRGGIAESITLWITTTDETGCGNSDTPTTLEDFKGSSCISNLSK